MRTKGLVLLGWLLMVCVVNCQCQSTPTTEPSEVAESIVNTDSSEPLEPTETVTDAVSPTEQPLSDAPVPEIAPVNDLKGACLVLAQATCTDIVRCCLDLGTRYNTTEECVTSLSQRCASDGLKDEKQALATGHASFSQQQLALCVNTLKQAASSCRVAPGALSTLHCKGIVQDKATIGEVCKSGVGGLHCAENKGVCFPEPTGVVCKAWSGAGTLCRKGPCLPSLYCDTDAPGGALCRAFSGKGGSCRVPAHCQTGLACLAGTCQEPKAGGSSCDNLWQCASGFACDITQKACIPTVNKGAACRFAMHCGRESVCDGLASGLRCTSPHAPGDACKNDKECGTSSACVSGRCEALPGVGKSCRTTKPRCVPSAICVGEGQTATCQPFRKKGESCTDDEQCEPGVLACTNGTCQPLPGVGETCYKEVLCAAAGFCDIPNKTCVSRKQVGEACPLGYECVLTATCVAGNDGQKRCAALPTQEGKACGGACGNGLVCLPGVIPGRCIPSICEGTLTTGP